MPSIKKAITLIEEHRPKTPAEFEKIGLPLSFLGRGAFREVCKIDDCPLVVKFPLAEEGESLDYRRGKLHTTNEVKRIDKLWEHTKLRKFLPKVYYHDRDSGVLVMHYYLEYDKNDKKGDIQFEDLGKVVKVLFSRLTGVPMGDVHVGNFHKGRGNHGVFIDFGY
jgi:hypothetical protein